MQRSRLLIPDLDTASQAQDLGNALIALSGIGRIEVQASPGTLVVEYDRGFLSEESLKEFVRGAGYPSAGDERPA